MFLNNILQNMFLYCLPLAFVSLEQTKDIVFNPARKSKYNKQKMYLIQRCEQSLRNVSYSRRKVTLTIYC